MDNEEYDPIFDPTFSVHRVAVKVPPFYRRNVSAWFRTLESQLKLGRITSSDTKFHHLVSHLPEDIAALLLSDKTPENYELLKEEVLRAVEKTKQEKINDLFDITDIGDERPSIFVRKLVSKMEQCGLNANDDEITQKLLRCLPPNVATPLRAFQDLPPKRVAAIADSMVINYSPQPTVNAVSNAHRGARPGPTSNFKSRGASEEQMPQGIAPFHPGQRPRICRAHIYYGFKARTCRTFCQFPKGLRNPRLLNDLEKTPPQSRSQSRDRSNQGEGEN